MNVTEQILETIRELPEPVALEILDFAEYLKQKYQLKIHNDYEEAKRKAVALMETGFDLGGHPLADRDALHER